MKHFILIVILFQDDNAHTPISMKIYSSVQSHQVSTQLNTCGRFWTDASTTIIKILNGGMEWLSLQ